jgi:hypothetical protein
MDNLAKLQQYLQLTDNLVELADKNELAECVRLLAMDIAHYKMKYGELPLEEPFAITYAEELNDQQRELVISSMETMVGVLGSAVQGLDEKTEH